MSDNNVLKYQIISIRGALDLAASDLGRIMAEKPDAKPSFFVANSARLLTVLTRAELRMSDLSATVNASVIVGDDNEIRDRVALARFEVISARSGAIDLADKGPSLGDYTRYIAQAVDRATHLLHGIDLTLGVVDVYSMPDARSA